MSSDTPRTDSATHTEEGMEWVEGDAYRLHELCKQLERENAALSAELAEYERTVAHMRDGARQQDSATAAVMERNEKLTARVAELVEALEDMVRQHCYTKDPDEVQSNALSANAEAIEILARHGRIEILKGAGRMLIGRWIDNTAMRGTE